jgi:hypothetical protein
MSPQHAARCAGVGRAACSGSLWPVSAAAVRRSRSSRNTQAPPASARSGCGGFPCPRLTSSLLGPALSDRPALNEAEAAQGGRRPDPPSRSLGPFTLQGRPRPLGWGHLVAVSVAVSRIPVAWHQENPSPRLAAHSS